jgi:hypothetical protein
MSSEREISTYAENINGDGSKDGEKDELRAICTGSGKYRDTNAQENSEHDGGTARNLDSKQVVANTS